MKAPIKHLSIRSKLRALSAFALIAPIMGFVAIDQVDSQLRQLQANQASQTTQTLASVGSLAPILQTLGSDLPRLYVASMPSLPLIDGYVDDWPQIGSDEAMSAAHNGSHLFLLLPKQALPVSGTTLDFGDHQLQLAISNTGIQLDSDTPLLARTSRAAASNDWVELKIDQRYIGHSVSLMLNGSPTKRWLVKANPQWQNILNRMASSQPSAQLVVADNAGLILAATHQPDQLNGYQSFLQRLYTSIATRVQPIDLTTAVGQQISPQLQVTDATGQYYLINDEPRLITSAPIIQHNRYRGNLIIIDQQIDATKVAGSTLLIWIIMALLASALALVPILAFANWLQRRIRALGAAVTQSEDSLTPVQRLSKSNDELGQLAKAFEHRTEELFSKNRYLAQLASILGHEIRTPIVVVQSSLEHLERTQSDEQSAYIKRARSGIERLDSSIRAMVSANHLEQSLANYELELVSVNDFALAIADNYLSLYGEQRLSTDIHLPDQLSAKLAPELIVQALDKLLDNAMRYATDWPVQLSVEGDQEQLCFRVTNQGPALTQQGQSLSEFGVSSDNHQHSRHLGLGLYVTDLIARHHQGQFTIRNLADHSGVAASITMLTGTHYHR